MVYLQYTPKQSLIHALDPRTKLIITSLLIIITAGYSRGWELIGILNGMILIFIAAKIPLKILLTTIRFFLFLLVFTLIVYLFPTPSKEGLYKGGFYALRLYLFAIYALLLTQTTTPIELTTGLRRILKPLERLRIPVSEMTMVMILCIRFIPLLIAECQMIIKAQESRGADFKRGFWWMRIKRLSYIIIPLFVNSLRRAERLAEAMESRAFCGAAKRTSIYEVNLQTKDYLAIISILIVATLIIWV